MASYRSGVKKKEKKKFVRVLGLQSIAVRALGERQRKRKERKSKACLDFSCMGDEPRMQNVPSLADVKSRKMAHYWDRKGTR